MKTKYEGLLKHKKYKYKNKKESEIISSEFSTISLKTPDKDTTKLFNTIEKVLD